MTARRLLALVSAATAATSLFGAAACNEMGCDTSPDSNPPADFRGGEVVTTSGGPVYRTSTAEGEHLNFAAGAQFRVHHQLGGVPQTVQLWVSFSAHGTTDGNEAQPAGNMAEVLCVNEDFILLRNDSCGEYWLRVVASDPVAPMSTGAVDSACP
ncbi:MAG: hypothetical protein IT374_24785 [Polyangiaceae bacterium]|nr:hypothetical protein [Polyangiaceae bacterium]